MASHHAFIKTKQGQTSEGLSILEKDRSRNKIKESESMNMSYKYLQHRSKIEDNKV